MAAQAQTPLWGSLEDVAILAARKDFPALHQEVHGRSLVYLDSAATTQKPQKVLDALDDFYRHKNANVHRGVHVLSERATQAYADARVRVARFMGAPSAKEIVWTRGTTEAINLVAQTYGRRTLGQGDEVLVTGLEHHANIVPWQMVCAEVGAKIRAVPLLDDGSIDEDAYKALLGRKTKIVALTHTSNALGSVLPVASMVAQAHAVGAKVLVDGAQAVPHGAVDVAALNCDFFAFSGHKVFGPTGIGALYVREALYDAMPPYQGGGDMIRTVSFEKTTYNDPPYRYEAGTPHIAGAVGLAAALEYIAALGMDRIAAYEQALLGYAEAALAKVPGLRMIGEAQGKASVCSFVLAGIHPHDLGTIVDKEGVAIRTGHHCAQPVMERFGVPATARASLAFYNTCSDVDRLVAALHQARKVFGL